ncbi:hypothetical protein [Streptomyces sp. NTK 937]|uniref:hypothetical protein n=1 Tax=Streptomyces sp. NTK 937 TaxID=1487711 RepID=UPI0004A898EC|nr:hypothetical protein [Streptomyces sp. NTK 937]KDQ65666.1 hypothetical protein DT87_32860 [Streptomyces sp. NTK 937]KDQ65705.1 hypothetical protein DT87_00155 [Streptomyces sp. NTK 937]
MNNINVGDRVRIIREYKHRPGPFVGQVGTLTALDPGDDVFPYCVMLDGDSAATWFHKVEPLNSLSDADRESLVARAKELLADTPHTVADIITMAEFLAGE